MKKSTLAIILSLALFASSCTREPFEGGEQEGQTVYLSLDCLIPRAEELTITTKATYDENCELAERKVLDLYIFVFSAQSGELIGYKHVGTPGSQTEDSVGQYQGYKCSVDHIKTLTGNAYICAVANPRTGTYKLSDEDYQLITNISEANFATTTLTKGRLESIIYQRTRGYTDILDGQMVFSGYYNGGYPVEIHRQADGTASITGMNGAALQTDRDEIQMSNIVSKNVITIVGDNFIPKYYELHNVPFCGELMPSDNRYTPQESRFENLGIQALPSKKQLKAEDGTPLLNADGTPKMGTAINIYLPQNLAGQGHDITKWSDREKNSYQGDDKHFDNAPDYSSYIVIYGQFDGSGANQDYAEARFTVHLGNFGPTGSIDNYDVKRGVSYHYNIDVRSVDDIIVEAMTDDTYEQYWNHGTEGVVISPNAINPIKLDCHYEARALDFDLKEVYEQINKEGGYILKIDTYFDKTPAMVVQDDGGVGKIYNAATWKSATDAGLTPTPLSTIDANGTLSNPENIFSGKYGAQAIEDYHWIKVVKNTNDLIIDANHTIEDVCKYPGTGDSRIMNIFEFLWELYKSGQQNGQAEGNVDHYTFFFDENYYESKPWSEYTNKVDKRYLYIANEFHESMDTKSIYAKAKYVFEQESIWQVYDPTYAGQKVAYGKEIFNEDSAFDKSDYDDDIHNHHDDWAGYTQSSGFMTGKPFAPKNGSIYNYNLGHTDIDGYTLHSQDTYNAISSACLSRNRDENGNGVLDADEIHWYVPSIGQMAGYFMGDDLYTGDAKTFDISEFAHIEGGTDVSTYHYFTCSDQSVFWAEEGASTSSVNQGDWSNATKVRCTRTLQSSGEGHRDPDPYYEVSQVTENGKTFTDITLYIANAASRGYYDVAILPSYGREIPNRVYKKFRVADTNLQENGTDKYWSYNDTNRPLFEEIDNPNDDMCATTYGAQTPDGHTGWRVPNMRELSVMQNALHINNMLPTGGPDSDFLYCNTKFSGHLYAPTTYPSSYGFGLVRNGNMTVGLGTGHGYVRCVRDVGPNE